MLPSYFPNKPLPSASESSSSSQASQPTKLRPTAALDGLRGVAALFVFWGHIFFSFSGIHELGYGVDDENRYLFQLPILRLVYSGHAMVTIFFVVGGYVLSIKPTMQIHSRSWSSFNSTLASSIFRRPFRLYIPAIVATFVTMLTISFGLWEYPRRFITEEREFIRFDDHHIERLPTFFQQFSDWMHEVNVMSNFFTYWSTGFMMPYYPRYDPHLWTIPVEFRSGLILMATLLGLSKCKTGVRLGGMVLMAMFCGWWDHWELVCFLVGSLLCQIDHVTIPKPGTSSGPSEPLLPLSILQKLPQGVDFYGIWTSFAFASGLYLLSTPPQRSAETPGFGLITALTPSAYTDPKRFPYTIGSALLVYSLLRSPYLRTPFLSRPAQYLGKISFALYVVHGPIIHMVGFSVIPSIWLYITGLEGTFQWLCGFILGASVLTITVLCAADAFWRWVEKWSVTVARNAEDWCFMKDDVNEK
jgi:peptidoglycan/LPS O-acetylase OafA/YrhL